MTKRAEAVATSGGRGRRRGEGRVDVEGWRPGGLAPPVLCGTDPQGVGGRRGRILPCVG